MKQKLSLHENEEVKFNNEADKKSGKGPTIFILVAVLIVVTFVSYFFIQSLSALSWGPAEFFNSCANYIGGFFNWIMGRVVNFAITIVMTRWLTVILVGATLAAVGAMFKSIFRNTLAAPTTLGVQEGGVLGCMIYIFFFGGEAAYASSWISESDFIQKVTNSDFMMSYGQTFFIFIGCFLGIFVVLLISTLGGKKTMSSSTLILVGTVVNGAIAGITGTILYELTMGAGDESVLKILLNVTMGTFNYAYNIDNLALMAAILVPCMVIMGIFVNKMDIYALGDEEAKAAGINVKRFRTLVTLLGVLMTAVTMVFVGHIAFIGFIVPQIAAKVVGTDFRRLYPASIILGGIIMVLVYDLSIIWDMKDGISLLTTFIAGIMIIFMLAKKRNREGGVIQ